MSLIDQEDLVQFLENDESMMLEIGDKEMAHEASYVRKHVLEMPKADINDALHAIKKYCDERRNNCDECEIADSGICTGLHHLPGMFARAHVIKSMPKWEPVENIIGEGSNTYRCPECGAVQQLMDGTPEENDWYYCPCCGSKLVWR